MNTRSIRWAIPAAAALASFAFPTQAHAASDMTASHTCETVTVSGSGIVWLYGIDWTLSGPSPASGTIQNPRRDPHSTDSTPYTFGTATVHVEPGTYHLSWVDRYPTADGDAVSAPHDGGRFEVAPCPTTTTTTSSTTTSTTSTTTTTTVPDEPTTVPDDPTTTIGHDDPTTTAVTTTVVRRVEQSTPSDPTTTVDGGDDPTTTTSTSTTSTTSTTIADSPTTATQADDTLAPPPTQDLADTGSDSGPFVLAGVALVAAGLAVVKIRAALNQPDN